jgi:pre-mRNA-splicing factor SYF2
MPTSLKRKGSPNLEESAGEPTKRRFAETDEDEAQDAQPVAEADPEQAPQPEDGEESQDSTSTPPEPASTSTSEPPKDERAARFAALRARNAASRKSNLQETKNEARRAATDPSQLSSLQRKKDVAAHKLLKAEVEEDGEDFERKRAWDWTVEESERWDERLAEKKARKEGVYFQDYSREAGKVYDRQIGQMNKNGSDERREAYEKEKNEAIERAVRSGGLEIVETESGELIAVDRDGSYYSTSDSLNSTVNNKPDKAAVDRLVADIKKAEEVRLKKRRERGSKEPGEDDVTYINEKNKQFNLKLARFYDKYTSEIRENFERGTAI